MRRTILATGAIVEAGPRVRWGNPGQRPMSAPVREKLVAFAEECPEVVAALWEIAEGCIARPPGHVGFDKNRTKPQIEAIARNLLARMAGEEPPR